MSVRTGGWQRPILGPRRRGRLWAEVAVVMGVGVVPHLIAAVLVPASAYGPMTFEVAAASRAAQLVGVLAVLWFVVTTSDEPAGAFGCPRFEWRVDLSLVVLAAVLSAGAGLAYQWATALAGLGERGTWEGVASDAGPATAGAWAVNVGVHVANGLAEELVIWGVLFTRLAVLTGRVWLPMVISAGVFASYHVYQGAWSAGSVLAYGLAHGAVFAWTRRVWPLAIEHALTNLWIDAWWAMDPPTAGSGG